MKLTQDQIQELYKFTRSHYVEHYDLQTELVDHLAHGIEQLQQENTSLTFQEALNQEFKKFGVFGFHDVIAERKSAMSKQYRNIVWSFFKQWFKLPKILLVLSLSGIMFLLLQILKPEYKIIAITILYFVVGSYFLISSFKNRDTYRNKIGIKKRWMLEEKILDLGEWAQMAIFPMYIFNLFNSFEYSLSNFSLELSISIFTVCHLILCYVMVFVIPSKAEKLLEETYPEYKMI